METSKIIERLREWFSAFVTVETLVSFLAALGLVLLVLLAFRLAQALTVRFLSKGLAADRIIIVRKLFRYAAWTVAIMTLLSSIGIDLRAVLGAAGIAGIAIGFAAQTSVSNVISGLFLISEKHFSVGDAVEIDGVSGIVQSVDFLSVKVRTWDNRYIRIPNETVIKANVTTISRFPIRRFDLRFAVSYKTDLVALRELVLSHVRGNPAILREPAPLFTVESFGDSNMRIMLGVWFEKSRFADVRDSLAIGIKTTLDGAGISMPFPQLDVHFDTPSQKEASNGRS